MAHMYLTPHSRSGHARKEDLVSYCGTADNPSAEIAAFIAAGAGKLTLSPSTAKRAKIAVYYLGAPCAYVSQRADGTLRVRNRPEKFNVSGAKPGPLAKATIGFGRDRAKARKASAKLV